MPRKPTAEEISLFHTAVKGSVRLSSEARNAEGHPILKDAVQASPLKSGMSQPKTVIAKPQGYLPIDDRSGHHAPSHDIHQLDGRTAERLKRGKLPIEGTIDLHGMTQVEAHGALNRFIASAYAMQKRCVLVITGKGGPLKPNNRDNDHFFLGRKRGILRDKLPEWLQEGSLAAKVVTFSPAQQKDGGSGAFYVYLRRHRS